MRVEGEEVGFSNWMTPSRGTSCSPTKVMGTSSLAELGGVEGPVGVAEGRLVVDSALATVRRLGKLWVLVGGNLGGLRLEKRGGTGFVNWREQRWVQDTAATAAPPAAWLLRTFMFSLRQIIKRLWYEVSTWIGAPNSTQRMALVEMGKIFTWYFCLPG